MQKDWFRSLYFKAWIVGSVVAILYMPLVTICTRSDPLKVRWHFQCGRLHADAINEVRSVHVPRR
jgi:hypothetical protein